MIWTTRQRSELAGLSAIMSGVGPPVLMIHGVGLRAEAWNGQIAALSSEFHVQAIDLPGHGSSPRPDSRATLTDFTDAAIAAIDAPALVIGHSMGAMMALDLAIRYPDQVRGVVALNAIYRRSADARDAVQSRAARLDGLSVPEPSETLKRWFGATTSPERDACHHWLSTVDPAGYRIAYRVFAAEDGPGDADLAALSCPVLFMTGDAELNSTPAMSRDMAERVPQGQAISLENAAHMMPMTHVDQINEAVLTFARDTLA